VALVTSNAQSRQLNEHFGVSGIYEHLSQCDAVEMYRGFINIELS